MSNEQNNDKEFKAQISPITYVNSKQIPILMMHGTRDKIVSSKHYKSFASKCKLKEVENFSLIEVDQGDHGFYFKNKDYLSSFIKKDHRKICSLILGGPTKYYDYSLENLENIFSILNNLLKKNDLQLVVIPSMRTPKNSIDYAKKYFGENHTIIDNVDKKAYLSALSISNCIVVTCDSSSMISEAALTGKPIYVANILPRKNDKRFKKFRNLFRELNIIRNLGEEEENWSYQKLDETNRVANIIKQKINS